MWSLRLRNSQNKRLVQHAKLWRRDIYMQHPDIPIDLSCGWSLHIHFTLTNFTIYVCVPLIDLFLSLSLNFCDLPFRRKSLSYMMVRYLKDSPCFIYLYNYRHAIVETMHTSIDQIIDNKFILCRFFFAQTISKMWRFKVKPLKKMSNQ